ncbi:putative non-specific serine/threonine protein kinase [Dioscorea sansibarensis]
MDEARGLDLNSRADHPEPSSVDPVEALATTPSAVAEADRADAGDGAGGELQGAEIDGQLEDGGDLKMEMVEGRSLERGEVVAGVRAGSGEVDDVDQLEKDGSCGDVEMVVDVRGAEKGDAFTGAEEPKFDGVTEVQGLIEDLDGVNVDVEEIGKQKEVKEEGVSLAGDVRGIELASVSGKRVIADEKRDMVVGEVEALSTVENDEFVVTPNGGKDSDVQGEVGMLDNRRIKVTIAHRVDGSEAGPMSGSDVATEAVVQDDRELEMVDRSGGDDKMMLDAINAPSSSKTAGLGSLEGPTNLGTCDQAEFVDGGASSLEQCERLIGDIPECDSEREMGSRKNFDEGLELTEGREVSMDEIAEPPSVAPSVPKTDSVEVSADLGDVDEHHQEKKVVQGSGPNILNRLVVVEEPGIEDKVGEHETVVLDLIDKNPDVQEVANASASEEEQKIESVSLDNNRPTTLTEESDTINAHECDGGDQKAAINLVPPIKKNLEVEVDAVLANEEVAKAVVSVPSDDPSSVPIMKISVSANVVVEAHDRDSYPIGESVSGHPVSTGNSVSAHDLENSVMDSDVQTSYANSVDVGIAQGGAEPNLNSESSGSAEESKDRSIQHVNENPDDGGDCSDANPYLLDKDMMEIDELKPPMLSFIQSFTSQDKQYVGSPHTEKQEAKPTIASTDDDSPGDNSYEAVPPVFPQGESVGLDASSGSVQMLNTESMNHTANASLDECCRHANVVQESEATAGLPFNGESALEDGSSIDSAFVDGDANFIMAEGGQDAMHTYLSNDSTEKVQNKENTVLERVDSVTVEDGEVSDMEKGQHARYYVASQDTTSVSVSDLVWGKVKSHPWWPGQIFDSSDASELALKYQKKDNFLVAYFGDKTFAWCEESQLKPFLEYFSQMANQSTSDAFINALDDVLQEVSRRVQLGMICQCTPEGTYAGIKYQKIDNAGVRKGTSGKAFDRSQIVNSFQPDRLLLYICTLAKFSKRETDRLDLVLAQAHLNAFYLLRGYCRRPVFFLCGGLAENDDEVSPPGGDILEQQNAVEHHYGKNKLRGRKHTSDKQNALEDVSEQNVYELMEAETNFQFVDGDRKKSSLEVPGKSYSRLSGRKHKIDDFDHMDLEKNKKERFDSLGDSKPKPSLIGSFKIGECIRRAASQLTGSTTPVLKSPSEALQKSVSKGDRTSFDVSGFDDSPHTPVETRRTKARISDDNSSSSEMLSQLCLAARDPFKHYTFIPQIVNFFSDFRNSSVSDSSKDSEPVPVPVEKVAAKRGRKKKTDTQPSLVPASSETSAPDYMSDSYWSDMLFHSSPESNLSPNGMKRRGSYMRSQRKKRKSLLETTSSLQPDPMLGNAKQQVVNAGPNLKQELTAERPIIGLGRKHADECSPTELVLCFNKPDSMPSRTDLIKIFGRYGPLKESATEVMKKMNRVKVVFKRRADAEIAFSSAGKYSIFGPSLISYRLRYLPSIPEDPTDSSSPQEMEDVLPGTTQQSTEDAPAEVNVQNAKDAPPGEIPQEARDADQGTAPDASSNVIPQDAEDAPSKITQQETNDAIPDITPDTHSEIMPQDAEDTPAETTQQDANKVTLDTTADAPSETAPPNAEDTLPVATSDAPNVTLQEVEHSLAETWQQDAEDILPDATADVPLLEMEDTPAETTQLDAEDTLPDTTSVAPPDIMLQDGEDAAAEIRPQDAEDTLADTTSVAPPDIMLQDGEDTAAQIRPQDAEDALPDVIPDVTVREAEDTHAETTRQDTEDALQNATLVAPPDVVLQDMEDIPAQTVPSDAKGALPDKISGVTTDVTLQGAEDTPAVPDTTLDAPSDTVLQNGEDTPAEIIAPDAEVVPSVIVLEEMEATPAETIRQDAEDAPADTTSDAHPDMVLHDMEHAHAEATPQDPEDSLPDTTSDAPTDKILNGMEDTPAENTPRGTVDETLDATPKMILQDVEDTPKETKQEDAEALVPDPKSDALPDEVLQDVEVSPAETSPQYAEVALPDSTTLDLPPNRVPQDVEDTPLQTTSQDANDALPDTTLQDPRKALQNTIPEDAQGTASETKPQDAKDAASKDSAEAEGEIVVDAEQVEVIS